MLLAADCCVVDSSGERLSVTNCRYRHFLCHLLVLTGTYCSIWVTNMHSGVLVRLWLLYHHTGLDAGSRPTEYINHGVWSQSPHILIKLWILVISSLSVGHILWLRWRGLLVSCIYKQAGISLVFIVLGTWWQAGAHELEAGRRYVHHTSLWFVILHLSKWVYAILLHVRRSHISLERHWIELFHVDHVHVEPGVVRVSLSLIMISLKEPFLVW